jgi:hypothetical protein
LVASLIADDRAVAIDVGDERGEAGGDLLPQQLRVFELVEVLQVHDRCGSHGTPRAWLGRSA